MRTPYRPSLLKTQRPSRGSASFWSGAHPRLRRGRALRSNLLGAPRLRGFHCDPLRAPPSREAIRSPARGRRSPPGTALPRSLPGSRNPRLEPDRRETIAGSRLSAPPVPVFPGKFPRHRTLPPCRSALRRPSPGSDLQTLALSCWSFPRGLGRARFPWAPPEVPSGSDDLVFSAGPSCLPGLGAAFDAVLAEAKREGVDRGWGHSPPRPCPEGRSLLAYGSG